MNNNVNMPGMNPMGGPVGGGMPMMNNGLPGAPRPTLVDNQQQRSQLNTYIYEYFLRNEMYECARAIIQSEQPINVLKNSPGRRDANGNPLDNGVSPEGLDGESKDDIDINRPDDLPAPNLPKECPESCFLYEWWCLFWDMFNAQRGKGDVRNVQQYVAHTQQQSRARQHQQQQVHQAMQPGMAQAQYQQMMMMRQQNPGMNQNELARKAMQNNSRNVPAHMQMLQAQQQQAAAAKQQQMQRDGSDMDGSRRPQSPGSAENAPSPSKRPRLEGTPFNNGQQTMGPNGRPQPQGLQGQQVGPANPVIQATQMLLTNGINPHGLTPQQFQNFQAQQQQQGGPGGKNVQSIQAYASNLVQHQQSQMPNKGMPNPNGPQSQGSPMMAPGPDGSNIGAYYNASALDANGIRQGAAGQPGGTGNHALQDYQMQLMLLEQQNKKRLMMARQEQDNMVPRDGSVGGQNGQPFPGNSPQGPRSSPNPNDQMKRSTPQMNAAAIPSPLQDGQSRGSPGAMTFMPGTMDPSMAPQFYKMNGMDGGMAGAMPNGNGMRPPSSHPTAFSNQMVGNQQQMMNMARQQQQQQQQQQQAAAAGQMPGWQNGPGGAPMMQQPSQGQAPQPIGTPQQRAMPPPSAPATGAPASGRTQPSSPQQSAAAPPTPSQANKANPKGKKDSKSKRNAKKGATTTSAATAATDAATEPATPTPATPTVHPQSFKNGQNGAPPNATNGQLSVSAPPPAVAPPQPDPTQNPLGFDDPSAFGMNGGFSMDFANPTMGGGDVLQDFDFDSFLHQDGDQDAFNFDASAFGIDNEVSAE